MKTVLLHIDEYQTPVDFNMAVVAPPLLPGVILNFAFDDETPCTIPVVIIPEMAQAIYEHLGQALQTIKDLKARN